MKRMPQPIPYQGSKRNLANQILTFFPDNISTLIEPFAGSASISVAASYHKKAQHFLLNDLNEPLIDLLEGLVEEPDRISDEYEKLWNAQLGKEREFYDEIRAEFNKTKRADCLLYLLARCVKGSIRYNSRGEFNQSPDNRRLGKQPQNMRQEIAQLSRMLKGRTTFTRGDYKKTLEIIEGDDLVYLDPPYQGTSRSKDPRYYSGLKLEGLIEFLEVLNQRRIMFMLSYDGYKGKKSYGDKLPEELALHRLEIKAGRSTQSTLLGDKDITYESLYLSPALVTRLVEESDKEQSRVDILNRLYPILQLELELAV